MSRIPKSNTFREIKYQYINSKIENDYIKVWEMYFSMTKDDLNIGYKNERLS